MNLNHTGLLRAEARRIDLFCAMGGVESGLGVGLIIVVDLRAETGRHLCAVALGEKAVEGRLKQAARRREIPSACWPLGDDEASNALEILALEYLGAARNQEPGQVPVLLVDQDDVLGFCHVDSPTDGKRL